MDDIAIRMTSLSKAAQAQNEWVFNVGVYRR